MSEMTWELLCEVQGRLEAEMLQSLLEANDVQAQLIQEGAGRSVYPVTVGMLGLVQVFVPRTLLEQARQILEDYQASVYGEDELGGDRGENEQEPKNNAEQE